MILGVQACLLQHMHKHVHIVEVPLGLAGVERPIDNELTSLWKGQRTGAGKRW